MANLLWGNVFYKDIFAGILREEPGERMSFEYDKSYLDAGNPSISYTLPIDSQKHMSRMGLHPFFDNLVAEGWLENAQTRLLGKRIASRFELLLAFGHDCAGAVSIEDPVPSALSESLLDHRDQKEMVVLTSRSSLSGIQPKLAVIERNNKYYPCARGELSTHIAKFSSSHHPDLILNEYLTLQAFKALLPEDEIVESTVAEIEGISEPALIIKRFDRALTERLHFEEFNQLLNKESAEKYKGSHHEMSDFIRKSRDCLPAENYRLYARILAGLLLGNTDMHFKNFAMFHTPVGLRLTPSYDQICAVLYNYKTIALSLGGAVDMQIGSLKAKNLISLAGEFELSKRAVDMLFAQLMRQKDTARETIASAKVGNSQLKDQLIKLMESRWNGTYALIGRILSKKP